MGKKQSDPNQTLLPGVELDDQGKFDFAEPGGEKTPRKSNGKSNGDTDHLPRNLAKPVKVKVPDFSDPKRPKTCLEVDFPLVPINALSALEGNAGKPIYQMSKWWARRRSCVFRAMLIAAAMEAPIRENPDGSPVLDDQCQPIPDETEAAKAVWDLYYANHQAAENFKHLKVLDCFMGGGTTLVEGSRLGFQVSGVDLNPVAWFVVKNELACTDPVEVKRFFDQIEAEVKPVIQPFYVTDCPRGHTGKWFELAETGDQADDRPMPADFDPITLPPDERKKYRYEGPEIIYTFWAKHGPCSKPGCGHRTPVFRSPVIAEKVLGVKYIELKCKECKTVFDAELGDARMAPGAEHLVLPNEKPFTALSQPFAQRLLEYNEGKKEDKKARAAELHETVEQEPGLQCPKCGAFAGQYLRDVLNNHLQAQTAKAIDKKHLKIEPPRNSTKPVYCYLLIHPDWLKGSPGAVDGHSLGGYADASVESTVRWYEERLKNLGLIEVRGRIKLSGDASDSLVGQTRPAQIAPSEQNGDVTDAGQTEDETDKSGDDRKQYGVPHYIRLADGLVVNSRKGTFTKKATIACQFCGQPDGIIDALRRAKHSAPTMPYALQCFCPECKDARVIYDGRFFAVPDRNDVGRLAGAVRVWEHEKHGALAGFWPTEEIPYGWQTHYWSIPDHGYTHWYRMFNPRQLLLHANLLRSITGSGDVSAEVREQALGAFQQYLRNQCMFAFWNVQADKLEPHFANNNYVAKQQVVENCVFSSLGRGNWRSCTEKIIEGIAWTREPWEPLLINGDEPAKSIKVAPGDPVQPAVVTIHCGSSSDLSGHQEKTVDLVITDPPFGDNFIYSELANFFYAWLRLPLSRCYPHEFAGKASPYSQEAVTNVAHHAGDANDFYKTMLGACWTEAARVLKDAGLLAFTFHHSDDSQWVIVLESLFEAGFILEQAYPIASDESKGETAAFGSKKIEYDIIHVCRKRLEDSTPVSWAKMRQWVKAELKRLRRLLESYKANELSDADIRVILRGKALEFYSRHYGEVFTAENEHLSLRDALLGINQLLDEDTGQPGERPPSVVQPMAYQFLQLFGHHQSLSRDEVSKSLRGTGIVQRELEQRGWIEEQGKVVSRVPIPDRFEKARKRPRKEMKSEIDQAHFLIGAATPGSGVNLEDELGRDTWMVRRSVEAVLDWYAKTAPEPEIQKAATLAGNLLRMSLEQNRTKIKEDQGYLFDDLYDEE